MPIRCLPRWWIKHFENNYWSIVYCFYWLVKTLLIPRLIVPIVSKHFERASIFHKILGRLSLNEPLHFAKACLYRLQLFYLKLYNRFVPLQYVKPKWSLLIRLFVKHLYSWIQFYKQDLFTEGSDVIKNCFLLHQ